MNKQETGMPVDWNRRKHNLKLLIQCYSTNLNLLLTHPKNDDPRIVQSRTTEITAPDNHA
jgi:hypothetical protein